MERIRRYIEAQVMSLSGTSLGLIDFEQPAGDPGLFGPGSTIWKVHGDFTSMLIGGITSLFMQALHPLALAGVWDHSTFRNDLVGRLRRTSLFISGTTFAAKADAEALIERVRRLHIQVAGMAADGRPYAASDPHLLTWVHVCEAHGFLQSYLRYRDPAMPIAEQDRYYREISRIAEALGASDVPKTRQEIEAFLQRMRPELSCDGRTREIMRLLREAEAPSRSSQLAGRLFLQAAVDLLPAWALDMYGIRRSHLKQALVRQSVACVAPWLRWGVRSGAVHRAYRRVGVSRPH